ncbi:CHASE2 domain-containing protein [Variovorax sp. JS1663]|uniref:CHASE2 domain-containing protein n=1 Tax=Variovorax sp. JS1663 TaxID=1851577 RepID=UPI000B34909B|nr:adenylate/guanylate cyclase domain-containing protein [Variovorax sp. JS1663]OUM03788.1 guanylate cyclase [Variovorax sp. JS1663]
MNGLRRHGARIAITLLPVLFALLHAADVWRSPLLVRLDQFIYDARLRATMPGTLDPRIVIVDIDEASLQQFGQWPWSRDKLARLTDELMGRQQASVLGFDVLFAEADSSSGLPVLRQLAAGPWHDDPKFGAEVERLAPSLDHDALFAKALDGRRVALGYYFTQTDEPRAKGVLPKPVLPLQALPAGHDLATRWNGFGANIPQLAAAAPEAGFFNVVLAPSEDGVVRSVPLIARYEGGAAQPGYYESLALVAHRLIEGAAPSLVPVLAPAGSQGDPGVLEALVLGGTNTSLRVRVDPSGSMPVPFRGPGGPLGGSFRYVSAGRVLDGALGPGELRGKVVLIGATAPGLQDLRATPVGAVFPGVEVHANIISGLLDRRLLAMPDYAAGYECVTVGVAGLLLAFGLSLLSAPRAALLAVLTGGGLVALNTWLYLAAGLVLPLATALASVLLAFAFNMSWGYFIEARASRNLASLFGTYVPPQLVDEMRADPRRYSMRAQSKELTVMFCDMRGFTRMSEQMAPAELQAFLNAVFSRLTGIISEHRGTVDKYMGDCVMAFWGAPVDIADHAALAVEAALQMAAAVHEINETHRASGRPEISVGIGLNTGLMSVGDMGSAVRRSYTVVGDAVNLASRLEGLSGHYGVEIVASVTTRAAAPGYVWQELDLVRVKGKALAVRIFTPLLRARDAVQAPDEALERWGLTLAAYRAQDWRQAQDLLAPLLAVDAKKVLYRLYAERLASLSLQPKTPDWDGATQFESK